MASRARMANLAFPLLRSSLAVRPQAARLYQHRVFTTSNVAKVTSGVSSQPPAKSFGEMKENAKQEASKSIKDVAKSISGANDPDIHAQSEGGSVSEIQSTVNSLSGLVQHVPKEAWLAGGAGFLPYVGTSLASIYLAREASLISKAGVQSNMDLDTALALLHHVQQIQVSYGAVILSFLGAIHWGFEFAGYGGRKGTTRYLMGIAPVLVGWPSLLLPAQMALAAQWAAFTGIWYIDSRATAKGWTPKWYSTYRFALTAIVGSTILVTLGASSYFQVHSTANVAQKLAEKKNFTRNARVVDSSQTESTAGPRLEGSVGGEIETQQGSDAYVLFENEEKKRQKEEEERKKKEEEEKKEQEEKAKQAKEAAEGKAREARDKAEGRDQ